ncbi:MAG TPA: hypothetical protein VF434_11135 [Promineifilum sp.]
MTSRRKATKPTVMDGIQLRASEPTVVPIEQLFNWVIWQFPRIRTQGFTGAVHPSDAGHGWYPAFIDHEMRKVIIFAHVTEPFPNPEAAAKHLDQLEP